jgi:hypothetical protein
MLFATQAVITLFFNCNYVHTQYILPIIYMIPKGLIFFKDELKDDFMPLLTLIFGTQIVLMLDNYIRYSEKVELFISRYES